MKQIFISLSCVEPWNTRHVTEAIIFSIPGLYALVCCGHSQASSELFCWPVVSHSSYSYWTSRRAWSWQGLNKCLFLPTLCILIWGAASLLHFDAFWPLVFASLCDKGPAQRWRVIVRERERDSTAAGFWRVLHRCTAAPLSPHTTTHWRSIMKQCPAPRLPPLPQLQHQQLEQPLLWYNSLLVRL